MGIARVNHIVGLFRLKQLSRANPDIAYLIERVRREKLTFLDLSALIDLYQSVAQLEKDHRAGIIVEAGCALGGSAIVDRWFKNPNRSSPYTMFSEPSLLRPSRMASMHMHATK
jgi:asparagine synthase (glutamine-hydrolysing)